VKRAQVEPDGLVSVIRQDWAEPLQKKDLLQAVQAREREARRRDEHGEPVGPRVDTTK
jgi:hypothetical protein